MSYSSKFLESEDSARELLLSTGYASSAAVKAITGLSELCVHATLIGQLLTSYECGESLPVQFDAEVNIAPIKLRGSTEVDILDLLESRNVLVRRSTKYRVILSNMMNRIFSLTATTGDDSIREITSNLHDQTKFMNALETIEWELITSIHDSIDTKFLDIPALEQYKVPVDLIQVVNEVQKYADAMRSSAINLDLVSDYTLTMVLKGHQGKMNRELLKSYLTSIKNLAQALENEARDRWRIIQSATRYPKSLLNRNDPPLIRSSWHLKPDFRNHPLVEKFKQLLNRNFQVIQDILNHYKQHIDSVAELCSSLPRGALLLDRLKEEDPEIPSSDEMTAVWENLDKQITGLTAQVKLFSTLIQNADTLFQNA